MPDLPGNPTAGFAAIDCGTNALRLLIARRGPSGEPVELAREVLLVRLGQGVDATGELHPDALRRTFAATEGYARLLREHRVPTGHLRVVATAAARDARNLAAFLAGMTERLGVCPEVISGAEEARLSYQGALSGVAVDPAGPVLVADIGGGSTELVLGRPSGEIMRWASLPIGSVRLTERFGLRNPVPAAAAAAAERYVDELLDGLGWALDGARTWIGVAGTATTISAVAQGLPAYVRQRVHGSTVPPEELAALLARLSGLTVDQIAGLGAMMPGRADVITAGALIADRIARRVSRPMLVSECDLLDGIVSSLLARASAPPGKPGDGTMPR